MFEATANAIKKKKKNKSLKALVQNCMKLNKELLIWRV